MTSIPPRPNPPYATCTAESAHPELWEGMHATIFGVGEIVDGKLIPEVRPRESCPILFGRLMRAMAYAYNRWKEGRSPFWSLIFMSLSKRVKEHQAYHEVS